MRTMKSRVLRMLAAEQRRQKREKRREKRRIRKELRRRSTIR